MSSSLSIEEIPVCLAIHLSLWLCTRPHLNISHSTFCFCGDWIQTQQPLLAEKKSIRNKHNDYIPTSPNYSQYIIQKIANEKTFSDQ